LIAGHDPPRPGIGLRLAFSPLVLEVLLLLLVTIATLVQLIVGPMHKESALRAVSK
jgi:hypothetical protein